jgi:hypothetical protein
VSKVRNGDEKEEREGVLCRIEKGFDKAQGRFREAITAQSLENDEEDRI